MLKSLFICCYYDVLLLCMCVLSRDDALSCDDNPYSTFHQTFFPVYFQIIMARRDQEKNKPDRPTYVTNEPDRPTEVTDMPNRPTEMTNNLDRPTEETKETDGSY